MSNRLEVLADSCGDCVTVLTAKAMYQLTRLVEVPHHQFYVVADVSRSLLRYPSNGYQASIAKAVRYNG